VLKQRISLAILSVLKKRLAGLDAITCDEILDLARRIVWQKALVKETLAIKGGDLARHAADLADFFEGFALFDLMQIIEQYRMMVWAEQYPDAAKAVFKTKGGTRVGR